MLLMKKHCETCKVSTGLTEVAFICSFECTFCESCTLASQYVCPNCAGDLLLRPTRQKSIAKAAMGRVSQQIKKRFEG